MSGKVGVREGIGRLVRGYQPHLGGDEVFSVVFPAKRPLLGEKVRVYRWAGPESAQETQLFLSGCPT
jgi:hypothetical protein